MGFLNNSRGDDPHNEDVRIFEEFALISQRRRHALTLDLSTSYQHTRNQGTRSVAIRLYPDHFYNVSPGFDQEEEEYDTLVFSVGRHAEDSSDISDRAADNGPEQRFSASAEDSEPQCQPAQGRKRTKKRKHSERQRGAGVASEEGGDLSAGPRRRSPRSPRSCTDRLKDKNRSKKRAESPPQHKHTSKDPHTEPSKTRSKRDMKEASNQGRRANEGGKKSRRGLKTPGWRMFPDSSSDKSVGQGTNEGGGQQVTEEEKRARKKKRKHPQQGGRAGKEPVTGTSRKRKVKDDPKSSAGQRSGEDPLLEPPKKKKHAWIINLFKGKTKAATFSDHPKEDAASPQKRKR